MECKEIGVRRHNSIGKIIMNVCWNTRIWEGKNGYIQKTKLNEGKWGGGKEWLYTENEVK